MDNPRVVFLGNSESVFSNRHFAALVEPWIEIVAVVDTPRAMRGSTNPDRGSELPPFTEIAATRAVPIFEPNDPNTGDMVRQLRSLEPDLLIAVGYVKLLRPSVLGIPRIVAANFHASLLPAYRGKHPVFWALRHGERSAGLTVHVMDPHIDTGDVLYRTKVRTRRRDSVATLYSRIMDRSVALVPRLVEDAVAGRLRPEKQGAEGASYYSSTTAEDFRLDWTSDRRALLRWIRATPSKCWFSLRGRTVYVQDATIPLGAPPESIGTIMRLGRGGCTVAVGGGALRLRSGCLDDGPIEHMSVVCAKLGLAVGDSLG